MFNWFMSAMTSLFGDNDPTTPPPNYVVTSWPTSDPQVVLAMTAWMEARGGLKDGMQAVMNVICNRANNPRWWGTTIFSVCMKPYQFSCWNSGSTQLPLCLEAMKSGTDMEWVIAMNLAELAVARILPDITDNSDSYYAASMSKAPEWEEDWTFVADIGGNKFGRLYLAARS